MHHFYSTTELFALEAIFSFIQPFFKYLNFCFFYVPHLVDNQGVRTLSAILHYRVALLCFKICLQVNCCWIFLFLIEISKFWFLEKAVEL